MRTLPATTRKFRTAPLVRNDIYCFEESIAGQVYRIEVSAVSANRWRAQIVRLPGVPGAMMPFYGETPAEAADQLSRWLTRAHARAGAPGSV